MDRRNFLSLTLGSLALAVLPASIKAADYRKLKPTLWTAHRVEDAIKNMYGSTHLVMKGVKLKVPNVASDGGAIPIKFSTKIPAKTIAVFQDANPESAVAVYDIGEYDITEYSMKIKMAQSGTITVVVEGQDNQLYAVKKSLDVSLGGCEG